MLRFFLISAVFLAPLFNVYKAHANILISPTRVIFEDRQRATRLVVVNNSDKVQSYRLTWQERAALPEGGYRNLDALHVKSLSPMVRMSPSQIRLAPGQKQIIKLSVRRAKDLAPGEYRSHLLLSALSGGKKQKGASSGINIDIEVNYSLPVIMRVGRQTPQVTLSGIDLKRTEQTDTLSISLAKHGEYSSFGTVEAFFKPVGKTQASRIGIIANYSIHAELEQATLPMTLLDGYKLVESGQLTLKYTGDKEYQGEVFLEEHIEIK